MSLPRARAALKQMNRDTEHLRLLAIFHYVAAGLAAFFSFFPLLYATIGGVFLFFFWDGSPKPGQGFSPAFRWWVFFWFGLGFFPVRVGLGILVLVYWRCLFRRASFSF